MIEEETVRKLVDYVLLNACAINSTGLYNGKVGLSLCLFEISRALNDEYIEEQAFDLLQEALLTKNDDISFENGISGIGYALLYLLSNKFIEADYNELFEENQSKIFNKIKIIEAGNSEDEFIHLINIVCFLQAVADDYSNQEAIRYIQLFADKSAVTLEKVLSTIKTNKTTSPVANVLHMLDVYLNVAVINSSFSCSDSVLSLFFELYTKNRLASQFSIGCHLYSIAKKRKEMDFAKIAKENCKWGLQNSGINNMSLAQQINLQYQLSKMRKESCTNVMQVMEQEILNNTSLDIFGKKILGYINPSDFKYGYQSGIARLLLYWVYRTSPDRNDLKLL